MKRAIKKPKLAALKTRKGALIALGILVALVAAVAATYYLTQKRSESAYYSVLTELNTDNRTQLEIYAGETKEAQKLREVFNKVSFDDASSVPVNKEHLIESRRIATQFFDRMLERCESYKDKFLHSTEIPGKSKLPLLPGDKLQTLQEIKKLLTETEDNSCTETKGNIGKLALELDMAEATNTWIQAGASELSDTEAVNSLKKFKDGSYQILYRDEIDDTYIKNVTEYGDLMIEMFAATYDYATATEESDMQSKYDTYLAAYNTVSEYSDYDEFLEYYRKESKEQNQRSKKYYDLIVKANQDTKAETGFAANMYSSYLIFTSLDNYYYDYEYKYPSGKNLDEIVKELKEKRYLDQNEELAVDGITFEVLPDELRKLTVTDSFDKKKHEVLILR